MERKSAFALPKMCFSDDYKFYCSGGIKRPEIGNAVLPLLFVAIAKQMLKAIKKSEAAE